MASVGLSSNFAALKALATEGIQRGHMALHSRNLAIAAGVPADKVHEFSMMLIKENKITQHDAKQLWQSLQ